MDFAELMYLTPQTVYEEADRITGELMRGYLEVRMEGKKYFRKYSLFSTCEYNHNGMIRFKLNPDMTGFLLGLKDNFTQPLLTDFLKMKSPYSMAIWHLMQREMKSKKPGATNVIEFDLMLDELREVTGTQNKLKQIGEFKSRCFDKALREIDDNCGVKITYENIKNGRTVIGFHCSAVSFYHIDESEIPQNIKDRARLGKLKIDQKSRELTPEEQEEYEFLVANSEQMELRF